MWPVSLAPTPHGKTQSLHSTTGYVGMLHASHPGPRQTSPMIIPTPFDPFDAKSLENNAFPVLPDFVEAMMEAYQVLKQPEMTTSFIKQNSDIVQ